MAALVDQPIVVFHVTTEGSMARSATPRPAARRCSPRPARSTCCSTPPTSTGRSRGRQMDVQPAGPRWRRPRGDLARRPNASRWSRPTTRRTASTDRQARQGPDPDFKQIANGIPGIELRLPLLFSEGVAKGRIDLERFVALGCTNPPGSTACTQEGHDRDRVRRRPRDLGPAEDGRDHRCDHPRRHRLLPLCGHDAHRLADDRDRARRGDRRGGRASGRARPRPLSAARRRRPRARQGLLAPEMDPAQNFGAELL